jgi:hypothetical protein
MVDLSDDDKDLSELKKFLLKVFEKFSEPIKEEPKAYAAEVEILERRKAIKLEKSELKLKLDKLLNELALGSTTKEAVLNRYAIQCLLGTIHGKTRNLHRLAQKKLVSIGYALGYSTVIEYVNPAFSGKHDTIDVVWKSSKIEKIIAAFEIRIKKANLDIISSEGDQKKLARLHAQKKFIVNVSIKSGKSYVHRV